MSDYDHKYEYKNIAWNIESLIIIIIKVSPAAQRDNMDWSKP